MAIWQHITPIGGRAKAEANGNCLNVTSHKRKEISTEILLQLAYHPTFPTVLSKWRINRVTTKRLLN